MPLTLSNYDNLLKDFYEGGVREQLNQEVVAFKTLDENDKSWSGRRVVFPLHSGRNSGVGARTEGATLPAAGNQSHLLEVVSACYHYGRGQLTGQTLAAGKHAFAEAMATEMEGLTKDLTIDLGRVCWGTGDGRLAQIGADGASASALSVYNRYAEPGQPGARYIASGMLLDAGTVASPTAEFSSQTVISVNVSQNPATTTDTVTISNSALTVSQCDTYLFNRGAGGAGVEALGFQALVDVYSDSNYWGSNAFYGSAILGMNRDANDVLDSIILGNSGVARIIDGNLVQTFFDRIHEESGEEVDFLWGHHSVIRAFLDSVSADRRYASTKFDAGMSSLTYNGVPLIRDRHATYNNLLGGKRSALRKFTLAPVGFADKDGAILSRIGGSGATDSYEFYIRTYFNLGIDGNFKSLGFIRDIKTDL